MDSKIIEQPYSGKYKEIIFDIKSNWNSSDWTYIEFEEDDFSKWCGVFRGAPMGVVISVVCQNVLILTSDYLYQMDCYNGKIIDYESNGLYTNLTVDKFSGYFIISDDFKIEIIKNKLSNKILLESPIEMDMIKFLSWSNNKLLISCQGLRDLNEYFYLELDMNSYLITILDSWIEK